jgi:hypothetical protein
LHRNQFKIPFVSFRVRVKQKEFLTNCNLGIHPYLTTIILITLLNVSAMVKEIKTEILINATPTKVWSILTNFNNYPNWNPFIKSIIGDVKVGNKIMARIEPPDASGMTFKPKILSYESNKELKWIGHFIIAGLFDGEHKFELIDNGDGTTTFIHSEKFTGLLVGFSTKMLDKAKQGFIKMNVALKVESERNNSSKFTHPKSFP